jgi:hypothetical protein
VQLTYFLYLCVFRSGLLSNEYIYTVHGLSTIVYENIQTPRVKAKIEIFEEEFKDVVEKNYFNGDIMDCMLPESKSAKDIK